MRLFRRGRFAPTLDFLIAGLGNPGPIYAGHRHNVGFMVCDELARRHGEGWQSKFSGEFQKVEISNRPLGLLKPQTFMNESGQAVGKATRFFKLAPPDLLVVYDEADLGLGRLQARSGGGLAGHNGLRSINRVLGTDEFLRLRVGIGRPDRGDPRPLSDFLLSDFSPEVDVEGLVSRAADAAELIVAQGLEAAQQTVNERI